MAIPTGEVHLFEIIDNDGVKEAFVSFCGKGRSDIAEQTKDVNTRPPNLPICQECETKWKNDPRSSWHDWINQKPIP